MILAVAFLVLCYRVYNVLTPPAKPEQDQGILQYPRNQLPDDLSQLGVPPMPPLPPPQPLPEPWMDLKPNPFWYQPSDARRGQDSQDEQMNLDIALLRIATQPDGTHRAQMRVGPSREWYDEGDNFGSFTLERIYADEGAVEVFSEEVARVVRLEIE